MNSLRTRLTLIFVGLAIGPQIVLAVILGRNNFAVLERQNHALQSEVVAGVGDDIQAFVRERVNELEELDQVHGFGILDIESQRSLLRRMLHHHRAYQELTLVDQSGQERIRLSRTDVVLPQDYGNRVDAIEFLDPLTHGKIYYGPVRFDEAIREPLITLSVPLFDRRQGIVTAVLVADVRFRLVWDLLGRLDLPMEGDVYVLNAMGQIVAHRNPSLVLSEFMVAQPVKDGRGEGINGEDVIVASQVLRFGTQELWVVGERPTSESLAVPRRIAWLTSIMTAVAVTIAFMLVLVTVRRVVRPIEAIAASARSIESGDFSLKIENMGEAGRDEIGDLVRAFGAMATRLEHLIVSLEQEVLERRQAEKALQLANERLHALDAMKTKFIGDISHELRTPVTNIVLYLELLINGKEDKRSKYEQILLNESRRLASLCNGILDFTELQHDMSETTFAKVDINMLVGGLVEEYRRVAEASNLKLTFCPGAKHAQVWGNADQVTEAVRSLLRNAIDYTTSGEVNVSTFEERCGEQVKLVVSDTGIGLTEEELTRCFDRFYRGDRVGQYNLVPGVGLGLSKVKEIVEYHGGSVAAESEVGNGTVFALCLPAIRNTTG